MKLSAVLTASLLACLGACLDTEPAPVTTGISLPLTAPGPQGAVLTLRNAVFEISIAGSAQPPVVVEASEGDATASVQLDPAVYQVRLRDGWQMIQTSTDGSQQPVEAILASRNPQDVVVVGNTVASASFDFLLASKDGDLQIAMGVHTARTLVADIGFSGRDVLGGEDFLAAYVGRRMTLAIVYATPFQRTLVDQGAPTRLVAIGPAVASMIGDADGLLAQALEGSTTEPTNSAYVLAATPEGKQRVGLSTEFSSRLGFLVDFIINFEQPGPIDQNGVPVDAGLAGSGTFTLFVSRPGVDGVDLTRLTGRGTVRTH